MATIKFYLRTKLNKLAPIYVRLTDTKGVNIIVKTPFKMVPAFWNVKKQKCKPAIYASGVFDYEKVKELEDQITALRDFILLERNNLKILPDVTWLSATIDKHYYKDAPKNETLLQYIRRFVAEAESGKRLAMSKNTRKRYAYGSLRVLRGFMLSFELFHTAPRTDELFKEKYTKADLEKKKPEALKYYKKCRKDANEELLSGKLKATNFNDISIDFYNDFVQFFYDRNCGANYIGKHIKTLKTIMRAAREEDPPLHNNMEIERKAFKAISEPSDSIYLTAAEVKRLFDLKLTEKHLQHTRDVFLAGVYTAQRYSDYSRISKENIREEDGIRTVEIIQKKTGQKCIIPISPELETILRRYDYTLPKTFEQKINDNIKKIGRTAGITEPITVEINKGGFTVTKVLDKCDLIKTHTSRRTGCTLMYLARIPTIDIMKISGHVTEREFLKYVKVGKRETAVNLARHPYFMGNTLSIAK